jgi:tetratricopeptide (TPR) repeat protein
MIRTLMLRSSAALLLFACGCGYHSAQSAVRDGATAFREKNYPKAIESYTRATKRITDSPELYYNLGLAHWYEGNMEPAQAAYQAALELRPGYGDAWKGLGDIAYCQKEWPRAQTNLERALAVATNSLEQAKVLNSLALVESARERYDLARLDLLRALKGCKRYEAAYYNLASLYRDKFNLREEALDNFEIYVRLADAKDEHYEKAMNNIKRLRLNLDRTHAEELDGVRRDPAAAAKALQEGARQHALKQYSKATKMYRDALAADPFTFSAAFGLAMALKAQGQKAEAAEAFRRAAEISPNHQDSYYQAADLLLQLKHTAEAAKVLDRAIARSPFNPLNAELMARIRCAESRLPEARAYGEFYLSLLQPNDRNRAPYEKWVKTLPAN